MEIVVTSTVENALTILNRKLKADGFLRELKLRAIPKKSVRVKLKALLAARRKKKNEARSERGRMRRGRG